MSALTKILLIMLLITFLIGSIYYSYKNKFGIPEVRTITITDSLIVIDSTLIKQLTQTVNKIVIENKNLKKEIKDSKSKIDFYSKLLITLEDSIKNISTIDGIGVRLFNIKNPPFLLQGNFDKQEPWEITFTNISADIDLEVITSENKYGKWETYVNTSDPKIKIADLRTEHKKYSPSIKERVNFGIGLSANNKNIEALSLIGFDNYGAILSFGTCGFKVGAMYIF